MKNINSEDKFMEIFLISMSIIILFITMSVILPCVWWPDFLGIYK